MGEYEQITRDLGQQNEKQGKFQVQLISLGKQPFLEAVQNNLT